MPDHIVGRRLSTTSTPIDQGWQSPFVGKSIEDAANFVRNAPKPPKPLNKIWFAVSQKERFKKNGKLLLCRILPVGGESDLEGDEEDRTEQFRAEGMSLMCKIHSDKQQKTGEDDIKCEGVGEVETQMQKMGVDDLGEDEGEFEVQMKTMKAGKLGNWIGQDDAHFWWLN